MSSRVLVTAALTYANGSPHIGHLLEAIQTDVYVRARKLAGEDVVFMWAADTHGTPIQLKARDLGIAPEELIKQIHADHLEVYRGFDLGFDIYHTTHSDETKFHAEQVFRAIEQAGGVETREVQQLYCPHDQMFLPDRFVKGTCPKCHSPDQYGDNCEKCGATYDPTDMKEPACSLCGTKPVLKGSEHLVVPLGKHETFLRSWLAKEGSTQLQESVRNYVMTWVDGGLRDWDISRDEPYFGFEIPGHPGKYFYVWFDAPVGYIGATQKWCNDNNKNVDDYWRSTPADTEIVHVIGKDIVYFHCLFWPAMLNAAGYTVPSRVQVHGWLTINGEKMSKSRGIFISGRAYLEHLPPAYLRYYLAAKLGSGQDDLDFNFEDFVNRVNADLVKKAANLASRCIKFIGGRLGGTLGEPADDAAQLLATAATRVQEAKDLYAAFESGRALRKAMEIAEDFNLYLTNAAPWKLTKSDPERARAICSAGVMASKLIAAILKPVLPRWAEQLETMLGLPAPLTFANAAEPLPAGLELGKYTALAEPIDIKKLEAIMEASVPKPPPEPEPERSFDYEVEPLAAETSIDNFVPIDLRVGLVTACDKVKKSKKLLQLTVDLGPLGTRNIFSGISQSYAPEELVGKKVVVYANLKPRKMRFGLSEGMVLAAGADDTAITVLELHDRARPGDRIT